MTNENNEELKQILGGEELSSDVQELLVDSYHGELEKQILYDEGFKAAINDLPQEYGNEVQEYLGDIENLVDAVNEGTHLSEEVPDEETCHDIRDSVDAIVEIQDLGEEIYHDMLSLERRADVATDPEETEKFQSAANTAEDYADILGMMQNILGPYIVAPAAMKVADENDEIRMQLAKDNQFLEKYPRTLRNYTQEHPALS
jgi:hypothetical protein